jgi:tRNA-Thr(GGU) m(6)t(6)A37 methyltransferase TsaA
MNASKSEFCYKAIGVIHSPYKEPKNVPIQAAASDTEGTIEIYPEYVDGLLDLEGFSHILLLCHLHLIKNSPLIVKPFLDDKTHGVFATRSPARPNKIGLSVVRLKRIERNILYIQELDIIDRTPLLDIKPYVPEFDCRYVEKIGWLNGKINKLHTTSDDGRFC